MRGRTLSDAFIIMDEAQNTTIEQMKMFVTRLGKNSKAVITGDLTQTDLPNPKKSGLLEALNVLMASKAFASATLKTATLSAITSFSASSAPTTPTAPQQQLPLAIDTRLPDAPATTLTPPAPISKPQ